MKKLIIILIAVAGLTSCTKKDNKKCWTCEIKYVHMLPEKRTVDICDKSKAEIDEIIKNRYLIAHNDSSIFFMECK